MDANFEQELAWVLQDEGGNVDDPQDHGGRTSRGITQREYDADRRLHALPPQDVFDATDQEVVAIYHTHYWQPWCPRFPTGTDYLFFNMAVNAGPFRATKLLQRALGVAEDGVMGPITLESTIKADARLLAPRFTDVCERWYRSLGQPRFLRGWLDRAERAEKRALSMLS